MLLFLISSQPIIAAATAGEATTNEAASMQNRAIFGEREPINVLFIGNSFSRFSSGGLYNSVQLPLKELAESAGYPMNVKTIAHGSAYWKYYAGISSNPTYHREMITEMVNQKWDYIVLQEQSKAPLNYIDKNTYPTLLLLMNTIALYQPEAEILLYMTHAFDNGTSTTVDGVKQFLSKEKMQEGIAAAYGYLGNKTGLRVVPVGMQFARSNKLFPKISLLYSDDKHPSYAGFYLAAACFYYEIFGTVPTGYPEQLTNCTLSETQLRDLESLAPEKIRVSEQNLALKVRQQFSLIAQIPNRNDRLVVQWKSFNPTVAKVDKEGVVTGLSSGKAVIMAITSDGRQATCSVTVQEPIKFQKAYYVAAPNDTLFIKPKTTATELTWSSYNKAIATVSTNGVVKALTPGRVKIQVKNKLDSNDATSYYLYVSYKEPTGLKAAKTGTITSKSKTGSIKVSWKKEANVKKYKIYRATKSNGTYSLIGSSTGNTYIDKKASLNKAYYYKVVAGNAYTQCDSDKSASVKYFIPKTPALNAKLYSKKYVRLTWKKNSYATGYVIYRSTKKNSGFTKIATLTGAKKISYVDKKVSRNKTYYYRILAFRKLDGKTINGGYSDKYKIRITNKK
jgi:hypothetical protein